ncbi:unnamed protein product [Cuscuta campestris]|uniref:Uncharacterized protein n=1 Tax=Cuscuta campestris TaxID=132261 RepID=A0A484K866_9ASTE|nr:unnamed protein product [Cuscuta campestris]
MSDREDSQNPSAHSYSSSDRSQTSSSSSSSSSSSERPATSPSKNPVDASTCAPSSSMAQTISVAQPGDEGFIQLDDRLLQEQPSYMQKPQVHELRNLMPDGYQLTYRATWKNIISLHVGTTIDIHYHSIKDLGRAFLCGLPPSNKKWKDKYMSIKFPPAAFHFAQNVWGKRMKRQVKHSEADDLVAWQATLWAGDASTRGLYNVGKWSVYPGRETDPEPEIILSEAIPEAVPLRRVRGSKAPVTAAAGPSRPGKKKKAKDTLEFDQLMEAGQANQLAEGGHNEEEAAEESLKRKRRKTEVVNLRCLVCNPRRHIDLSFSKG